MIASLNWEILRSSERISGTTNNTVISSPYVAKYLRYKREAKHIRYRIPPPLSSPPLLSFTAIIGRRNDTMLLINVIAILQDHATYETNSLPYATQYPTQFLSGKSVIPCLHSQREAGIDRASVISSPGDSEVKG